MVRGPEQEEAAHAQANDDQAGQDDPGDPAVPLLLRDPPGEVALVALPGKPALAFLLPRHLCCPPVRRWDPRTGRNALISTPASKPANRIRRPPAAEHSLPLRALQ